MAEDTDTPSEMYVDSVDIYEWDDFYYYFGFYPDESEGDDGEESESDAF